MSNFNTTFLFKSYDCDLEKGIASFHYQTILPDKTLSFSETVSFPAVKNPRIPDVLLQNILQSLLLMIGISYWKIYCSKTIEIEGFTLSKEQAEFWNTIYTKGLGEFFYKNQIDFHGLVQFPYKKEIDSEKVTVFPRQNRSLLLVGGGKDSLVSGELLKKDQKPFTAFVVNPKQVHKATIHILGGEKVFFTRKIDAQVVSLKTEKGTYHGHVPVTAINSFLALFAAVLYDYQYIIASDEKSADYGNVIYLGEEINHQWSKSDECKKLFQSYITTYITSDITYFSLLNRLSELRIAEVFSRYEQYFPVFSSCNRNFQITKGENEKTTWCGECPKCAFVFILLAAFLPKEKVHSIFNKNLFVDEELSPVFEALLGLRTVKPFECVGTPQETQYAMYLIHKKGEFENTSVMQMFVQEVLPLEKNIHELEKELFAVETSGLPEEFKEVLRNV